MRLTIVMALLLFAYSAMANICILEPIKGDRVEGFVLTDDSELARIGEFEISIRKFGANQKAIATVRNGKNGHFLIGGIPPGEYNLRIVSKDFAPLDVEFRLVKAKSENQKREIVAVAAPAPSEGCPLSKISTESPDEVRRLIRSIKKQPEATISPPLPSS